MYLCIRFRYIYFLMVVLGCAELLIAEPPQFQPIWNFDKGVLTEQKGSYNFFSSGDSDASVRMDFREHRGNGGRAMKVTYKKGPKGYCGVWLHLFDENDPPKNRKLVDISPTPYLSFWVKGAKGGEEFEIQMADAQYLKKDDSRSAGPVSRYLKGKVTTNWREVVVPYTYFNLRTKQAAVIALNFTTQGEGAVYIDDIHFKKSPKTVVPSVEYPPVAQGPAFQPARAMWVWETSELLYRPQCRAKLFNFCKKNRIDELFMQFIYEIPKSTDGSVTAVVPRVSQLRRLIREAHKNNIRVHALDGYPEFALTDMHPRVLAMVKAVIEYNKSSAPEERFYGIHLDNEPYQILGFQGSDKQNILEQYLEGNRKVMDLLKKEDATKLVYGVDIPFWFDEDVPPVPLQYNNQTKDLSKHLIDLVDNVGIMDYRNFAGGMDGIITHGLSEIEYASKVGKKIYIGFETYRDTPSPTTFVYGIPEDDWKKVRGAEFPVVMRSNVEDFPIRTFTSGKRRYFGLAQPVILPKENKFEEALAELYQTLGAESGNRTTPPTADLEKEVRKALNSNPDFKEFADQFKPITKTDPDGKTLYNGFVVLGRMPAKTTFAGMTKKQMEDEMEEVTYYFKDYPAFAGFAIHYFTTYQDMPDE